MYDNEGGIICRAKLLHPCQELRQASSYFPLPGMVKRVHCCTSEIESYLSIRSRKKLLNWGSIAQLVRLFLATDGRERVAGIAVIISSDWRGSRGRRKTLNLTGKPAVIPNIDLSGPVIVR
jgi:hypothetical protein